MHNPPSLKRVMLAAMATAALLLSLGSTAVAQDAASSYPNKPIRLIVPVPPGGQLMAWRGWWRSICNRNGGSP